MSDLLAARAEIEKIIRALRQTSDRSFLGDFLERSGTIIVGDAKRLAPVDRSSLRRAITHRVTSSPQGLEVGVLGGNAKGVPYAELQEFGGTIKPTKRKWLTIPLEEKYRDRPPRSWDLVFNTIGAKSYLIDRTTGKAAYRLMKSVKIKGQPYLTPAINTYLKVKFDRLLNKMLDEVLKG